MMISERRRLEWRGIAGSLVGVLAIAGIALAGLAGGASLGTNGAPTSVRRPEERTLSTRLAAIDAALARKDKSRAVFEWRDAYGVALGSRRWDAMAAVGDAALKIDVAASRSAGHPSGFRAEARQAYLRALFDARAAGSPEGIHRAADAFGALGDAEMAMRVRAMAAR